jgi:PAS domain S-box-containing protein
MTSSAGKFPEEKEHREARGGILILAAVAEDAGRAAQILGEAGVKTNICRDLSALSEQLNQSTEALLITEEALVPPEVNALLGLLQQQAKWSDIPVIVLTRDGVGDRVLEIFGPSVNVTLLERPLRSVTLVATVKVALRARDRQREVRYLIQQLRENEERLRLAVESADVGTFDFYPPTGELQWSQRCNEIFGLPPKFKVTYEMYVTAVHPEDRHIIHEIVERVLQPGGRRRYDIEYRVIGIRNGKERWVSEKGRAILDEAGHAVRFIGTILDITESKNAAIALERAKKEAEDASRAKDQFLAMLSHELRTPLTPVLMTIAALQRDPGVSDEILQDLETIQRNIELEALLIDDLLDLTRIEHGKLELHNDAVNIHTGLDHALGILATEVTDKNLTITKDFRAIEHHSWADGARLQQVFWNLIKNAVKFTGAGGQIDIHTRNDEEHCIIIDVVDNGVGIEPGLQPKIFDAFEQGGVSVTSRYGGLGLGLAISKRVIDLHGGNIEVTSAGRGQGSTFRITLQAMETSLLEGPARYMEMPAFTGAQRQVLLVEDHEDTARVLRRMLEGAGYGVGQANSLAGARDLATKRPFDLLISDLGLPDGSGLELMRELRDRQGMCGIALSGFGMDDDLAASKAAGFSAHLTKPVEWERLRAAIISVLPRKKAAPEEKSTQN